MSKIRQTLFAAAIVGLLVPAGVTGQGILIGVKGGVNSSKLSLEGD